MFSNGAVIRILVLCSSTVVSHAFVHSATPSFISNQIVHKHTHHRYTTWLSSGDKCENTDSQPVDPLDMRLRDVDAELKSFGVMGDDIEALRSRLMEARETAANASEAAKCTPDDDDDDDDDDTPPVCTPPEEPPVCCPEPEGERSFSFSDITTEIAESKPLNTKKTFDREATKAELQKLRGKELQRRLGERNIRWGGIFEKDGLVALLLDALEQASDFGLSGALEPGIVNEISDEILSTELGGAAGTPLLLDVFATWCGPCQMMSPELSKLAQELGERMRIVKVDSDQYPGLTQKLRVGSFPTLIVFDADGKEAQRVEGALMKDDLLRFTQPHLLS